MIYAHAISSWFYGSMETSRITELALATIIYVLLLYHKNMYWYV